MKNLNILLALLIPLTAHFCKAKSVGTDDKNAVTFEVELDSSITVKPQVIIYENAFYQYGNVLDDHQQFEPDSLSRNRYRFVIRAQNRPKYFTITARSMPLDLHFVSMFVFEPGDNIKMRINRARKIRDFDVVFSGEQSAKYT
jgi:hypothetical protein